MSAGSLSTSPPRWNYAQVREISEKFLQKHHPNLKLPIPIEEIVEINLGINLDTVPRLKEEFDIDGFIHSNFQAITIDDYIFNTFEERARFTVAHEIGHAVLHKNIYEQFNIKTKEDYRKFQNSVPDLDQKWLEIQANTFAGCLLVPSKPLKEAVKDIIDNGAPIEVDYSLPVFQELLGLFNVSGQVMLIRLQREGIVKNTPRY